MTASCQVLGQSLVSTHIRVNRPQAKYGGDDEEGKTRGVIIFDWKERKLRGNK